MAKKRKLSPALTKFARDLGRTKNIRVAAIANLPAAQDAFPHQIEEKGRKLIKENKDVRKTVLEVWEAEGLTVSLAAKRHKHILTSTSKNVRAADTLKAADMVYRGHGLKVTPEPAEGSNPMINIFLQQRKERGLPIPEGVVVDAEVVE